MAQIGDKHWNNPEDTRKTFMQNIKMIDLLLEM